MKLATKLGMLPVKKMKIGAVFNLALCAIFVLLFAIVAIRNPSFVTYDYIASVMLRNMTEIGLMALPVTLIVITGGIDLSVGSILVLSAMVGGITAQQYGSAAGTIACLVTGLLCGLFNGILVAKLKINALVTTLATMYLFMGLARSFSKGDSVSSHAFSHALGNTYIAGFPMQVILYALIAAVFVLVLDRSTLGRKLFAIGLNENATRFSGVGVDRVKIGIYMLSGLVCAFASLIHLGRFTSIKYNDGASLNLRVVTIIVLGGTSILGGVGDMKGTVIATLILAVLNSGLTVMGIPIDTQIIVNGVVLVISLLCYSVINTRIKRKRLVEAKAQAEQPATVKL